ncbi:Methyltransferase domain-containing protein [Gammaproteobacteria bacterium]
MFYQAIILKRLEKMKKTKQKPVTLSKKLRVEAPGPEEIMPLMVLFGKDQYADSIPVAQALTLRFPQHLLGWSALGASLMQLGRFSEALGAIQKVLELSPENVEAHANLGFLYFQLGRLNEAETCFRQALKIKPNFVEIQVSLGDVLYTLGKLDEAEVSYRRVLAIRPNFAEAVGNLGNILHDLGQLNEAEACFRRALEIKPSIETHYNLGSILQEQGRLDEAGEHYQQALKIKPDAVNALNNLAVLLNAQGQSEMALSTIQRSLTVNPSEEAKSIFVACAERWQPTHDNRDLRALLVQALRDPWGKPSDLAPVSMALLKLNPSIGDPLLITLLDSTPVCDWAMEHFLTQARSRLLDSALAGQDPDAKLDFYCALARQCFINEYVFSCRDDEDLRVLGLRDTLQTALENQAPVAILWVVAIAAYVPLGTLTLASRLLGQVWPESVKAILKQQITEPEAEQLGRASIPRLTAIEDEVSRQVQNQYEENPYPRWVKAAPAGKAMDVIGYLRRKFPLIRFAPHNNTQADRILIAGCGTGQHAIATSRLFPAAEVLAIDLSLSSLTYAKRKTQELGITAIKYAQADLLKLDWPDRRFDLVESVGVLHHLADPLAGWRTLLSPLRPGGFMRLGFYSEIARRDIVRARNFIAEQGYGSSASEIRRCRQDSITHPTGFGSAMKLQDFFTISSCRDLLFHVHEHHLTLAMIDAFLRENQLIFLGFEIRNDVLFTYQQRFPNDPAATRLDQWQILETEKPDTFLGMYQFWIQKAG